MSPARIKKKRTKNYRTEMSFHENLVSLHAFVGCREEIAVEWMCVLFSVSSIVFLLFCVSAKKNSRKNSFAFAVYVVLV